MNRIPPVPAARASRRRAFTLVELLVVIAIVIVLAAASFALLRSSKAAAKGAVCVNRLRDVGGMLIARAADNGGRIQAFQGGNGGFDYRPYFIIRDHLALPREPYEAHYSVLRDVMFCPAAPDPVTPHWNTYGVNFTDSKIAGATWNREKIRDSSGDTANVSSLFMATVASPSSFLLVADSCRSDGQQIFRISGSDRVGLRHGHRANGFFLDGSARSLGVEELGRLGFKNAYDPASNPPKSVDLPQDS